MEILFGLAGAVLSLALGALIPLLERLLDKYEHTALVRFLHRLGFFEKTDLGSFQMQMAKSLTLLDSATKEVDQTVRGITKLAEERQRMIAGLETQLAELTTREGEIRSKIQTLEQVPIAALHHFDEILRRGDRRSAYRDYALFGLGVVVSTIVAVALRQFGL